MIRYSGSLCWCSLKPFVPTNQACLSQALMLAAEVVNRTDQIHPCFKRTALSCYGSSSSHKCRQALSKCGVEPFYERCVDDSSRLRPFKHLLNVGFIAQNDAALNADHTSLLVLLDRLRNEDSLPELQAWATRLSCRHSFTKYKANRADISFQSICAEQDTNAQGRCTGSHFLNQRVYK